MAFTRSYLMAREDFHRQRRLAAYQMIAARLTGRDPGLLSFEDVSKKLRISGGSDLGYQEIPVEAIVGSVSRNDEFTRTFMPLSDQNMERWSRVKVAVESGVSGGLPPIDVYKIGEAYFVIDGHNRVSVAREIGAKYIQAKVTEIRTRAPLEPNASPEDLILASEKADFLEKTHFDSAIPETDLHVTLPGFYNLLFEHIEVHRYYMGLERDKEIPMEDAVRHWYDEVYLPVKKAVQATGILQEFPGRTEADLYIWVSEHRYLLERSLGWAVSPERAARHLAVRTSPRLFRVLQRLWWGAARRLTPRPLQGSPVPGEWRRDINEEGDCLFNHLLVPVSSVTESMPALEQAAVLVRCTGGSIQGLFVASAGAETGDELGFKQEFEKYLNTKGIHGSLAVESGDIPARIIDRAALADLVVLNVAHPTGPGVADRFTSGLHAVILGCPRPVLAVPGNISPLDCLLLAYDGSSRAREALYVAAFFAGKWRSPLTVLSVGPSLGKANQLLDEACLYLADREVEAVYLARVGAPGEEILSACRETGSNLILMGGYGYSPVMEMVLGSTVDHVLRQANVPVLICK